jgi:hypothetical protein
MYLPIKKIYYKNNYLLVLIALHISPRVAGPPPINTTSALFCLDELVMLVKLILSSLSYLFFLI